MTYTEMLIFADSAGLITKEKDLQAYDGRIKGRRVAVRRTIPTQRRKAAVLAEELGHHFTSTGYILGDDTDARKQEQRARLWAYNLQIGLPGLIAAYKAGCITVYDAAEYLDVPENFFRDAVTCYHSKYGSQVCCEDYVIVFDPHFEILTKAEARRRTNDW